MGEGFVDTHLHLDDLEDPVGLIAEARRAGIGDFVAMGVGPSNNQAVLELAAGCPGVWAGAGQHPNYHQEPDWDELRRLVGEPRVVAVGEIGIDTVSEHRVELGLQLDRFDMALSIAVEARLPVSVHIRAAERLVLERLRAYPGLTGVVHYFAGNWEVAVAFLDAGFHLSFSGLVTRKSQAGLREVAARCPADRLLLETDAPYGTPRGRRAPMRPAWLIDTAQVVAAERGLSLEALARLERANARALFTRIAAG